MCFGPGIEQGKVVDASTATFDLAGTFLDFAGVDRADGMTTTSLRPVLNGSSAAPSRSHVSSGLAIFRLVIKDFPETKESFKFVCCNGTCPGAPSTVPAKPSGDGFTRILYELNSDINDLHPLPIEGNVRFHSVAEELAGLLPEGWCPGGRSIPQKVPARSV